MQGLHHPFGNWSSCQTWCQILTCAFVCREHLINSDSVLTAVNSFTLLQMDHIHKALISPCFGLTSPLKRKPGSCGVYQIRFNSEVGGVVW